MTWVLEEKALHLHGVSRDILNSVYVLWNSSFSDRVFGILPDTGLPEAFRPDESHQSTTYLPHPHSGTMGSNYYLRRWNLRLQSIWMWYFPHMWDISLRAWASLEVLPILKSSGGKLRAFSFYSFGFLAQSPLVFPECPLDTGKREQTKVLLPTCLHMSWCDTDQPADIF